MSGDRPWIPPYPADELKVSDGTWRYLKEHAATVSATPPSLFGIRVVVDPMMPNGFLAIVGPPKDPHSPYPLDRLPQVTIVKVGP